jgi:hypothetical protein
VRYDHGEIFVDMSHAAKVGSRCSRVSIGSFLGRVMYRCEIIARPCKARFEQRGAIQAASLDAAPVVTAPPAPPPPQATPPRKLASPLAVWKRLTQPLHRRDYRAAPKPEPEPEPALPPDQRPLSVRHATLFIGHIVMGALGTMELAPTSMLGYAHELLNAMAEFPILYRALAISEP